MYHDHETAASSARPPDWRRRLAEQLEADGRRPVGNIDAVVWAYYLSRRAAAGTRSAAPLDEACRIDGGGADLRVLTDAWLLTGAAAEHIGEQIGAAPETIAWYAALFFDVRSRLLNPAYIRALLATRRRSESRAHADWLWAAYYGGAEALAEALGRPGSADLATLTAAHRARLEWAWTVSAATNDDPRAALRGLLPRMAAAHRQELPLNPIEENIRAMMAEIPWRVGPREPAPGMLGECEKFAAELRAAEMLAVGLGLPLPNAEEIRSKTLPPPGGSDDNHSPQEGTL